jgi:TorA maturation chaperone TorD
VGRIERIKDLERIVSARVGDSGAQENDQLALTREYVELLARMACESEERYEREADDHLARIVECERYLRQRNEARAELERLTASSGGPGG